MSQWQPIYLRADDEAAMMAALDAAGLIFIDEDEQQQVGGDPFCIRVLLLPNLTETTGEGEDAVSTPIPGYHVNVIVRPDCLDQYTASLAGVIIDPPPETPHVKYAGCG